MFSNYTDQQKIEAFDKIAEALEKISITIDWDNHHEDGEYYPTQQVLYNELEYFAQEHEGLGEEPYFNDVLSVLQVLPKEATQYVDEDEE